MSVSDAYEFAQEWLSDKEGLSIAKILPEGNVLFRNIETGRFDHSADFWTEFRGSYAGGGP